MRKTGPDRLAFRLEAALSKRLPGRKSVLGQMWRYLFTGGLAFVVDFGLFALCLYALRWHYLVANLAGLVAGLVVNYWISVRWVFSACRRSVSSRPLEFSLFALIGLLGVLLNQLLMWFQVDFLDLVPMPAKLVSAAIVLLWNFGIRKMFLFKSLKD